MERIPTRHPSHVWKHGVCEHCNHEHWTHEATKICMAVYRKRLGPKAVTFLQVLRMRRLEREDRRHGR